ncbi:MAG: YcxB family protein [Lachnospiraceae bacterium]
MEYRYKCDVKAMDFWKISMSRTYRSVAGVVNIVFTVAMILLTLRFWNSVEGYVHVLLLFACSLFPIIQPLAIYGKSVKQTESLPKDVELLFDDAGVHITCKDKSEDLKWNRIVKVLKQPGMIIVMSDATHGYMLMDRVLGDQKEELYNYLCDKTNKINRM